MAGCVVGRLSQASAIDSRAWGASGNRWGNRPEAADGGCDCGLVSLLRGMRLPVGCGGWRPAVCKLRARHNPPRLVRCRPHRPWRPVRSGHVLPGNPRSKIRRLAALRLVSTVWFPPSGDLPSGDGSYISTVWFPPSGDHRLATVATFPPFGVHRLATVATAIRGGQSAGRCAGTSGRNIIVSLRAHVTFFQAHDDTILQRDGR